MKRVHLSDSQIPSRCIECLGSNAYVLCRLSADHDQSTLYCIKKTPVTGGAEEYDYTRVTVATFGRPERPSNWTSLRLAGGTTLGGVAWFMHGAQQLVLVELGTGKVTEVRQPQPHAITATEGLDVPWPIVAGSRLFYSRDRYE